MKAKPIQSDELRMTAADFVAMMRRALSASPKDADASKIKETKARGKKQKSN